MKTIYLNSAFQPVAVPVHKPGNVYHDPGLGDCRRMTAKRFCLAAERLGKESDAFLGLLNAICGAAENGVYDGRAIADWYGLVGLEPPKEPPPRLVGVRCPECGAFHYALEENGRLFEGGRCGDCWTRNFYTPMTGEGIETG